MLPAVCGERLRSLRKSFPPSVLSERVRVPERDRGLSEPRRAVSTTPERGRELPEHGRELPER